MNENEKMAVTEPREESGVRVYIDNNPQPELPMEWFGFYKVLLVIWTVGYILYGLFSAVMAFIGGGGAGLTAGMILFALFCLALGVICLWLFINLRRFMAKAYKANLWFTMILGIFGAAGTGISVLTMRIGGFGTATAVILGIVYGALGLIYPLCSIIYFEKRKHLFVNKKEKKDAADGEASVSDISDAESEEVPSGEEGRKKLSVHMKYLIVHVAVSVVSVIVAAVLMTGNFNADPDDWYGQLAPGEGSYQEIQADAQQVKDNFDYAAVYLGYTDADELMTEIEMIEEEDYDNIVDLHAMTTEEAYQFIFVDYFGFSDYDDALFAVNPYNNEVIKSFTDYQDYVMMGLEEYFEEFE